MSFEGEQRSRPGPPRERRPAPAPPRKRTRKARVMRQRAAALVSLVVVAVVVIAIVRNSSGSHTVKASSTASVTHSSTTSPSTLTNGGAASSTGRPGTASVPILVYHVINTQPPQSTANPALYVPADEFSGQMQALKAAGWHAVTLNQVAAYWARGTSLGAGKPIVITFDNGYASHYVNAFPVLKRLGWVGVESLPVTGLPPADGGLTDTQVRGLIAGGWELDSQGLTTTPLSGG